MEFENFRDYIHCKAFDVISGDGSYRRYLYQCVENQDAWALRMHESVTLVSAHVREFQLLVDRVRQLQTPVARVETDLFQQMFRVYNEGSRHVIDSLQNYLCSET